MAVKAPQAFPTPDAYTADGDHIVSGKPGMTLRDYFAAQAIVGAAQHLPLGDSAPTITRAFAEAAYSIADAMLERRSE
jgi:hypothetical protein